LRALTFFNDGSLKNLSSKDKSTLIHASTSVRELPEVALRSKKLGIDKDEESEVENKKSRLSKPKPM